MQNIKHHLSSLIMMLYNYSIFWDKSEIFWSNSSLFLCSSSIFVYNSSKNVFLNYFCILYSSYKNFLSNSSRFVCISSTIVYSSSSFLFPSRNFAFTIINNYFSNYSYFFELALIQITCKYALNYMNQALRRSIYSPKTLLKSCSFIYPFIT